VAPCSLRNVAGICCGTLTMKIPLDSMIGKRNRPIIQEGQHLLGPTKPCIQQLFRGTLLRVARPLPGDARWRSQGQMRDDSLLKALTVLEYQSVSFGLWQDLGPVCATPGWVCSCARAVHLVIIRSLGEGRDPRKTCLVPPEKKRLDQGGQVCSTLSEKGAPPGQETTHSNCMLWHLGAAHPARGLVDPPTHGPFAGIGGAITFLSVGSLSMAIACQAFQRFHQSTNKRRRREARLWRFLRWAGLPAPSADAWHACHWAR